MKFKVTRKKEGFKWCLFVKEFVSWIILVCVFSSFYYFNIPWWGNVIIGLVVLLFLFCIACPKKPYKIKRWYNERESTIEYDSIEMHKEEAIWFSNRDIFWEYFSILGVLIIPLSFIGTITFMTYIMPYINSSKAISISIKWYYFIGALVLYLWFVAWPVLRNLKKIKYDIKPHYKENYKKTANVRKLKSAFCGLDNLILKLKEEEEALSQLEIPVPAMPTEINPAPYIDYVKEISEIGKSHNKFASLEQLLLSVTSFPNLDGWSSDLLKTFKAMGHVPATAGGGIASAVESMKSFVHHPDNDTSSELMSNIIERLKDSGHSQFFRTKLIHFHNKFGTLFSECLKDAGKGTADTFIPCDLGSRIHDSLGDAEGAFEDLFHHFIPEFDLSGDEMFEAGFDFEGHFPIITTAREVFKNIGRHNDGNVDMESSIQHSLTKVAGVAGGAGIGALIGSVVFPGVGTVIGSMIGGWLERSGATKLNIAEFERLRSEFEAEKNELDRLVTSAQESIRNKQISVNTAIRDKAVKYNEYYKTVQQISPLSEFNVGLLQKTISIIIYDYIWDCAEQYSPKNKVCNNEKYTALLNILPTRYEMANHKDHMFRMLSDIDCMISLGYIDEPKFMELRKICTVFQQVIMEQAISLQALHLVWMEQTRLLYTSSIRQLTKTMESEFESLNNHVKWQESIVKGQSDKCEQLVKAANDEAKTL